MGELEQSVYRRGKGHWVNWNKVCVRGDVVNWNKVCVGGERGNG